MKKFIILIFVLLFSSHLQANTPKINECMSDVYYANSIMTSEKQADRYKDLIKRKVLEEQYAGSYIKMDKELNFKTSYNKTHGSYGDIYDTYMFLSTEEDGWKTYENVMKFALEQAVGKGVNLVGKITKLSNKEKGLFDKLLDAIDIKSHLDIYSVDRSIDLSKQITDYRNSIRLGHGIIIVAHGKGDIFMAKAYKDMLKPEGTRDNSWIQEYISWMSVGSPTKDARGFHPYINFDNDTLAYWSTLKATTNLYRSYIINAVGEAVEQKFDIQFHSFNYYMGEPILFKDGYGQKNISTDIGKKVIMDFLASSIQKHKKASSQWATDQELNKGTKDYRITVKHLYDASITSMNGIEVYPFKPSKKLYHVIDNTGGNGWVKASCGGKEVFDYWDGKKNDEAYLIDNIEREKIISETLTMKLERRLDPRYPISRYPGNYGYAALKMIISGIPNKIERVRVFYYDARLANGQFYALDVQNAQVSLDVDFGVCYPWGGGSKITVNTIRYDGIDIAYSWNTAQRISIYEECNKLGIYTAYHK